MESKHAADVTEARPAGRWIRPAGALIAGAALALVANSSMLVALSSPVSDQSPVAGQSPVAEQSPPSTVPPITTVTTVPASSSATTVPTAPASSSATAAAPGEPRATFGSPDPQGSLDVSSMAPGGLRVAGWAIDPDVTASIDVHVYLDGSFVTAVNAEGDRPDVGASVAGFGDAHGFDVLVPAAPGQHVVCVYGINQGSGANSLLGCRSLMLGADPFGSFDIATLAPGGTRVAGWAIDPGTAGSIPLHLYVDGALGGVIEADANRSDVGAANAGFGDAHGFDGLLAPAPGFHTVCAYGINRGAGTNSLLGCRWVLVDPDPMGSLDVATWDDGGLHVGGWALDPDTAHAVKVHVYVDDTLAAAVDAVGDRSDVAEAFPGFGSAHGLDVVIPASSGPHTVCVYGLNQGAGTNSLIGCRTA